MPKRWNKKGISRLMLEIGQSVIAIFAIVILIWHAVSVAKGDAFQRDFVARDIALMVSTMSSIPGNTVYFYSSPIPVVVNIAGGLVSVRGETARVQSSFPTHYPEDFDVINDVQSASSLLVFEKVGNTLRIGTRQKLNKDLMNCPVVDRGSIVAAVNVAESKSAVKHAQTLMTDLGSLAAEIDSGARIQIESYTAPKGSRYVRILYPKESEEGLLLNEIRLGCLILNRFIEDFEPDGVVLLPGDVAPSSGPSLRVELPIVSDPEDSYSRLARVSRTIRSGIEQYYGIEDGGLKT